VEDRFAHDIVEEEQPPHPHIAAVAATLVAHRQTQRAAHVIRHGERDTSNWKWLGRWERLRR
jgi:hypothetical protein